MNFLEILAAFTQGYALALKGREREEFEHLSRGWT